MVGQEGLIILICPLELRVEALDFFIILNGGIYG